MKTINDLMLLIYPILLLFIVFFGASYAPRGQFFSSAWNHEQSKYLQGAACLAVMLHHLTQEISSYGAADRGPITLFANIGILLTSVFFFFSGYGLIVSEKKKPAYLKGFLQHRLPVILIPFFTANVLGLLIRVFFSGIPTRGAAVLRYVTGLVLINGNGWYFVEIFFLYLGFYLIYRLVKNRHLSALLLCAFALLLIWIGYHGGHPAVGDGYRWFQGEWWYNSTIVFCMGVLVAQYEEKWIPMIKRHYRLLLSLATVLLVTMYFAEGMARSRYGYYRDTAVISAFNGKLFTLIMQMLYCLVFVWFILLLQWKIKLGNRVLRWLSSITVELFLVHGFFVKNIFGAKHIPEMLYFFAVIGCSLLLAPLMHMINQGLLRLTERILGSRRKVPGQNHEEGVSGETDRNISDSGQETDPYRKIRMEALRKRRKRIAICTILGAVVLGMIGILSYVKVVRPSLDYRKEVKMLQVAKVGDEIRFGRYEQDYDKPGKEPLIWIVLEKTEDGLLLMTKEGIAGSVYHRHHEEITWEDSDLRKMLNEELYGDIFSKQERELLKNVSGSAAEESSDGAGDKVTLLTVSMAKRYFHDAVSRQLMITPGAIKDGTNINTLSKANSWDMKDHRSSWWWLRGEERAITAPIVSVDGEILPAKKYVNKPGGALRPVVLVKVP